MESPNCGIWTSRKPKYIHHLPSSPQKEKNNGNVFLAALAFAVDGGGRKRSVGGVNSAGILVSNLSDYLHLDPVMSFLLHFVMNHGDAVCNDDLDLNVQVRREPVCPTKSMLKSKQGEEEECLRMNYAAVAEGGSMQNRCRNHAWSFSRTRASVSSKEGIILNKALNWNESHMMKTRARKFFMCRW